MHKHSPAQLFDQVGSIFGNFLWKFDHVDAPQNDVVRFHGVRAREGGAAKYTTNTSAVFEMHLWTLCRENISAISIHQSSKESLQFHTHTVGRLSTFVFADSANTEFNSEMRMSFSEHVWTCVYLPVKSSNMRIPRDQQSAEMSWPLFRIISGATYSGVPQKVHVFLPKPIFLAKPKST